VRKNFKPAYEKLGKPSDSDSPETRELRATLFGTLGNLGKDPEVIAEAKELAEKYLADPSSVEPTLAQTATGVAARNGDVAFFDQLQKTYETSCESADTGWRVANAGDVQGRLAGTALA